ncbi:hypothetical protein Poly59_12610 [Rubripirellula reticaptiva]|uniref:Uncharacterized protein n=1 Tax=Rubripirellula reticaptiva TaxID=2528013 RepID=A0A5C6FCJ7_9BACT|nr:hypothetical protein Poly59_12610 [Rubripirellula reticaptiva]
MAANFLNFWKALYESVSERDNGDQNLNFANPELRAGLSE